MRKIIFIALILSTIILTGCTPTENYISDEIQKANYCQVDTDCADAGSKCPFGCYIYVNKKEINEINKLLKAYKSECVYSCINCPGVQCKNNQCVPVCDQ
jgi:hypothetical protein